LIRGFLAPERIETITPDLIRKSKQFSDQLQCPIRLHAAQSAFEYHEIRKRHQHTPIGFLASLDFLGPRSFIPHAIYTSGSRYVDEKDERDLKLLSDSRTTVIHCPVIMARHGLALESVGKYARAGIRIGMGTDTFPPDMIQNMRIGSSIAKSLEQDASGCTSADFFRMATIGGANALGRDDLGRLKPGAKADMIIIDLDDLHIGTVDDPIRTMVLNASGTDVKTSIIHGRIVMQDRKIPGIDVDAMREQAQNYFEKMKNAYSERDYLQRPVDTLFPPSFRTRVK
jgi:cytosine/adenosine deaminase-related metal-dependent hydrolase